MALTNEEKTEIRDLIHQEIGKAFEAAFDAALNRPSNIVDALSQEKRDERERENIKIREVEKAVKDALRRLRYPNSKINPEF